MNTRGHKFGGDWTEQMRNSKNVPLYLLCFAAGNPRGGPIAVKIAQDILEGMQNPSQLTLLG